MTDFQTADVAGRVRADRIFLAGHERRIEIGAFESERGTSQRVAFAIEVEVARRGAEAFDDVDRILSYDRLVEAIEDEIATGRVALLETLAEGIAARILAHPLARAVVVRVEKLDLGPHRLGVEIARRAAGRAEPLAEVAAPALARAEPAGRLPEVAATVLDPRAADVGARISALRPPALIVPVPEPEDAPVAAPEAARRLALLALDAAAWRLHARAPEIRVAASRAEIEHVLRRGATCVWAPARLLLAATDAPGTDPETLAAWITEEIAGAGA